MNKLKQKIDPSCQILVRGLDEKINEEILYMTFIKFGQIRELKISKNRNDRSQGYGFITFQDQEQANNARLKMNNESIQNFPSIQVIKCCSKEELKKIQQNIIFIGNIPPQETQKSLQGFFSQFGNIYSLKIKKSDKENLYYQQNNPNQKQKLSYGYITFENESDLVNLMQLYENNKKQFTLHQQQLIILPFKKYNERKNKKNNLYIKKFITDMEIEQFLSLTDDKAIEQVITKWKDDLIQRANKFGNTLSVTVKVDDKIKKPYAFINFEKYEDAVEFQKSNQYKHDYLMEINQQENQKNIINVTNFPTYEELQEYNKSNNKSQIQQQWIDRLKNECTKFGEVKNVNININCGQPQATIIFQEVTSANNCLEKYFIQEQLKRQSQNKIYIDFHEQFKSNKAKKDVELKKSILQQQTIPILNLCSPSIAFYPTYPYPPIHQYQQNFPYLTPQQIIGNISSQQQNISPQWTFELIKTQLDKFVELPQYLQRQQLQRLIFPRVQQHLQKEQAINIYKITAMLIDFTVCKIQDIIDLYQDDENFKERVQESLKKIISQNQNLQQQQLEYIKKSQDYFVQLPHELQRQLLGELIFPRVKQHLANDSIQFAPKITGMLINFSVFEVREIIEFLDNDVELKERVQEGLQLITSQNQSLQEYNFRQQEYQQTQPWMQPYQQQYRYLTPQLNQGQRPGYQNFRQQTPQNQNFFLQQQYIQPINQLQNPPLMLIYPQPQQFFQNNYPNISQVKLPVQPQIQPQIQSSTLLQQRQQPQQPNSIIQQQENQIQQQNPSPQWTFEYIKKNLDKFVQQPIEQQRQQLGKLIFPGVQKHLQKDQAQNAPKITSMLIDFSVFEVQDIIEFLDNDSELKERIQEAEKLIESQNKSQK